MIKYSWIVSDNNNVDINANADADGDGYGDANDILLRPPFRIPF